MSVTIGIDLGTTNSCVAVLGGVEVPDRQGLIDAGRLWPVGNALVIADRDRSPITPSAVWISEDGEVVVGREARQNAVLPGVPPPATFFKRRMGWDGTLIAGYREITPAEASTHVLRHLRGLAEDVLGQPVTRAVITVPAHFETNAKNATTEAGRQAGLDVVDTLLEPVAGGLSYLDQGADGLHADEPRTFLVYDLGGGTFDVSVVTWDAGSFDLRATGGDRFLGGYDFDKALLRWVVEKSVAFDLAFDENVPEEAASRGKLLVQMERLKIELTAGTRAVLLDQHSTDRDGSLVNIRLPIDRAQFESLIETDVAATMEITDRVCEEAGLAPEEIDEIVLVGGSARIPRIKQLLTERWGRAPSELDPDLCVGVGAALRTATVDETTEHLQVARPDVAGGSADLHGQVLPGGPLDGVAGRLLELRADDGTVERSTHSDGDGRFSFLDVPVPHGATDLLVRLLHNGSVLDEHRMTVAADAVAEPAPDPVLARTFSVRTRSGALVVVEGGRTKVPHTAQVRLVTAGRGTTLVVPVLEGDVVIGELRLGGLSPDLPVGTPVDVDLAFSADWRIEAEVRVPSVGARGTADMSVQNTTVDDWGALRARFAEASGLWEERRDLMTTAQSMTHGPAVRKLVEDVAGLLKDNDDLVKTNARLCALENALPGLPQPAVLEPSWPEFESVLDELTVECDVLALTREADAERFRRAAGTLRTTGETAYRNEDQRAWASVVKAVYDHLRAIDRMRVPVVASAPSRPDAAAVRSDVADDIDEGCRQVRRRDAETRESQHDEASRLLARGAELRALVDGVDTDARDAASRLARIRANEVQVWLGEVERFPAPDIIDVDWAPL